MKILRTLRVQLALIIIIAILIPVSVIGYYALVYQRVEKSFVTDTEGQLTSAAKELQPLFANLGPDVHEADLAKIQPSVSATLKSYGPMKVSYFNGTNLYSFTQAWARPKLNANGDSLIVSSPDSETLAEMRSMLANVKGITTKETEGDFLGQKGMDAYLKVGRDNQGLLVLEARLVPFILENHMARQGVTGSLLLGFLIGIIGVLTISHRLQKGITQIQSGLERAATNLEVPLEDQSGELGTLVKSINQMREELMSKRKLEQQLQLTERLAGLGKLTAGVAHEIRNPLGIMKGTIQLMERDILAEPALNKYREHMQVLQEQINRQNRVVEELLTYAKPVKPRFGPVSVSGIIDSVLSFLSPSLHQQGITLCTDLEANLPTVYGDGEKLKQVLVNLLINSKEALAKQGEIKISAKAESRYVEIQVEDNGPGIPQANLDQIFEPFFSTKEAGTGLGLSIAKQLIEQHHGELFVASRPGEGTSFTIRIPLGGETNAQHTGD